MPFPKGSQSGNGKATQCRATSKQRKRAGDPDPRCRRYASSGKTLCILHGSKTEGVPALQVTTHGLHSAYVKVDDVEAITTKIEQAKTPEGRIELLSRNAALLQHRLEQVPITVDNLQIAAGGAESVRRQLETLADLDDGKAQPVTTFVVASFDPAQQAPFRARGLDGDITVRLLDDKPYVLDEYTRAWWPAIEQTDEESGAKWFSIDTPEPPTH
jgi:hypothetical protein